MIEKIEITRGYKIEGLAVFSNESGKLLGDKLNEVIDHINRLEHRAATTIEPLMWVPVDEKLPVKGERVLVLVEGGSGVYEAFLDIRGYWQRGGIVMEKWYGKVTHWMPLPESPVGDGFCCYGERRCEDG